MEPSNGLEPTPITRAEDLESSGTGQKKKSCRPFPRPFPVVQESFFAMNSTRRVDFTPEKSPKRSIASTERSGNTPPICRSPATAARLQPITGTFTQSGELNRAREPRRSIASMEPNGNRSPIYRRPRPRQTPSFWTTFCMSSGAHRVKMTARPKRFIAGMDRPGWQLSPCRAHATATHPAF